MILSKRFLLGAGVAATLFGSLVASLPAQAQTATRIRGTIQSFEGGTLVVKPRSGAAVTVKLADNFKVIGAKKAEMTEIKSGSFIGTATVPQPDGTAKALEVTVFPASMKGMAEGSYGWDLAPDTTMTNGTIGDLVVSAGRVMTVHYDGVGKGEKKILVPEDVPVVLLNPDVTAALLKPGVHVVALGSKAADGTVTAGAVIAGENGTIPPMW